MKELTKGAILSTEVVKRLIKVKDDIHITLNE